MMSDHLRQYLDLNRAYHNLSHISDCLSRLAEFHELPLITGTGFIGNIQYYDELIIGILYHDAVYVPGAKNNELLSAQLAVEANPNLNQTMLTNIIMATTHVYGQPFYIEEVVIADIDLAGLGSDPTVYFTNAQKIWREVKTDSFDCLQTFCKGRMQFLKAFLARPKIYYSDLYYNRYETQARSNMATELKYLQALEDGLDLDVIISLDGPLFLAQGHQIDYAADGGTIEEAIKNFREGLTAALDQNPYFGCDTSAKSPKFWTKCAEEGSVLRRFVVRSHADWIYRGGVLVNSN